MIQTTLQMSYPNEPRGYHGLTSERHKLPAHGMGIPWQGAAYLAVMAIAGFALDTGQVVDKDAFNRDAAELLAKLTANLKVAEVTP
jgi:hypothetical protein